MDGSLAAPSIIDVHGVDADQFDATLYKIVSGIFSQVWVVVEVLVSIPVGVPAGMHQYSSPSQFLAAEEVSVHCNCLFVLSTNNDAIQVCKPFHTYFREVLPALVAMKWAIEIGAGIGHHFDLPNLELGPLRVVFRIPPDLNNRR